MTSEKFIDPISIISTYWAPVAHYTRIEYEFQITDEQGLRSLHDIRLESSDK